LIVCVAKWLDSSILVTGDVWDEDDTASTMTAVAIMVLDAIIRPRQ
jgi:hypothetical protein